jgi:NAD(P)-dependent dehydrogenase (short-subunit alcohol dehydrogenase family)
MHQRNQVIDLANKVAVVTGAARGMGLVTARTLATSGARVAMLDINGALVQSSASALLEQGLKVMAAPCDVTDGESIRRAIDAVAVAFGTIDVLANIAGAYVPATTPTHLSSEKDWDLVVDSNLKGIFLMSSAVLPHMLAAGGGRIINFSSNAGRTSSPVLGASYTAAKAGVLGLSRHFAKEYASHNILVNSIAPGPAKGERGADLFSPEIEAALLADIPLGRLADAQEVANVVLFLASDLATYMTGATLDVNGGYVMV